MKLHAFKKLFTFLLITVPAVVFATEKLQVGILHFPPFYYYSDVEGKVKGDFSAILTRVLEKAKVDYDINIYPPKRLYVSLGTGEVKFFMGLRGVPEYDEHVVYSAKPRARIQLNMYANVSNVEIPVTKEAMKGKSIVLIQGFNYSGFGPFLRDPKSNVDVFEASSHLAAIEMLKAKRVPFLLNYDSPVENVLQNYSFPGLRYKKVHGMDLFMMLSKSVPNAKELMKKLDQAYNELKAEGGFDDLNQFIFPAD